MGQEASSQLSGGNSGGMDPQVAVMSSATPPWGCGPPKPVNVRFNTIKVRGPDSDVVYHQVTVRDVHLQFATNTSVSLPGDSFLQCAKVAASAGMDAFVFNGSCTGYELKLHFLTCQTGDLVVYVLPHYLDVEPVVVPFAEAPYELGVDDKRLYMLSAVVETGENHPLFQRRPFVDSSDPQFPFNTYIFAEDYINALNYPAVDLDSCLNDGAYGLAFDIAFRIYNFSGKVVYFFEECGKTVQMAKDILPDGLRVYSHRGFGCQYYPSDLPDACTVIFEKEDLDTVLVFYGFFFPETDSDHGGLNMTLSGTSVISGETFTKDMYMSNAYSDTGSKTNIEVSVHSQPSKRAIGFYMAFT